MTKNKEFDKLITDLGKCNNCISILRSNTDCSLINIYEDKKFAKEIPSIWTDWYNRLDSEIMIIGQDWGPYNDMKILHDEYKKDNTKWKYLIEQEKSMTKKQLTKYINISSKGKITNLDNMYISNAIMCARKGNNYRGNNINLKYSTSMCTKYLKRQIDIVKPKVILTLGYYPLLSLSIIFNFEIEKTLKLNILKNSVIKVDDYVIIPLYHPVAQVSSLEQLNQYNKIWDYINI